MPTKEQDLKLDKLDQASAKGDSRRSFSKLVVVKLGVQPKPYYPKLKDESGKTVVDENGVAKRSEKQAGWQYTVVEYRTCETVRFVYPTLLKMPRGYYVVSGYGYDGEIVFVYEDSLICRQIHDVLDGVAYKVRK